MMVRMTLIIVITDVKDTVNNGFESTFFVGWLLVSDTFMLIILLMA